MILLTLPVSKHPFSNLIKELSLGIITAVTDLTSSKTPFLTTSMSLIRLIILLSFDKILHSLLLLSITNPFLYVNDSLLSDSFITLLPVALVITFWLFSTK